jgi:hypothetical protein
MRSTGSAQTAAMQASPIASSRRLPCSASQQIGSSATTPTPADAPPTESRSRARARKNTAIGARRAARGSDAHGNSATSTGTTQASPNATANSRPRVSGSSATSAKASSSVAAYGASRRSSAALSLRGRPIYESSAARATPMSARQQPAAGSLTRHPVHPPPRPPRAQLAAGAESSYSPITCVAGRASRPRNPEGSSGGTCVRIILAGGGGRRSCAPITMGACPLIPPERPATSPRAG